MAFDWREYLVVADELAKDRRQGMLRTSISRAYYCIYHLGLDYAQRHSFTETLPSLHRKLWAWYQKQPDKRMKELGVLGARLKESRIEADYNGLPITGQMLEVCLARAHEFEQRV